MQGRQIYESRLSAMLPSLNEAVREYSDLQAAVVSHLFPERWEVATQECVSCNGTGYVPNPSYTGVDMKSKQLVCTACNGLGAVAGSSPYKKTVIRLPKTNLGEQAVPVPPFDYVKKDIEVIKVMEDRVERHKYRALSAINMQFLDQVPLSISGDAKKVDRDELNNFVYTIAEDIVYMADLLYEMIADYRYSYQYPVAAERRRMLPFIPVPEQYELLGSDAMMDTIGRMTNNHIGGSVLTAMLAKYAKMEFWQESDISDALALELQLDRYSGLTEADILAAVQAGHISATDYRIHLNIKDYVKRALEADADFAKLPYDRQYGVLVGIAEGEMKG